MPPSASQPGYKQSYVASPHDLYRRQSKAPGPTVLLLWQTRHYAVRKPTAASDDEQQSGCPTVRLLLCRRSGSGRSRSAPWMAALWVYAGQPRRRATRHQNMPTYSGIVVISTTNALERTRLKPCGTSGGGLEMGP